jgi:hypothetical protein
VSRLILGAAGSDVSQRRISDSVDTLSQRKEARSFPVVVNFGTTPSTSATATIRGLSWITTSHHLCFSGRSLLAATSNLRVSATDIVAGVGFTLLAVSSVNLTGEQTLSCIAV